MVLILRWVWCYQPESGKMNDWAIREVSWILYKFVKFNLRICQIQSGNLSNSIWEFVKFNLRSCQIQLGNLSNSICEFVKFNLGICQIQFEMANSMVFTFNPQAYLLLREREKAGVEPISKVLIFSTFAAESQFFITGSHWPCKAFGQSAFWRGVEGGGGGDQHLSDGQQTQDGQLKKVWQYIADIAPSQHFKWFHDAKWGKRSARDIHAEI